MLFNVIFFLSLGVGGVYCQKSYTSCLDIVAAEEPSPEEIISYSPFLFRWTIATKFDCGTIYFVKGRYNNGRNAAIVTFSNRKDVITYKFYPMDNNTGNVGEHCDVGSCSAVATDDASSPANQYFKLVAANCNGEAAYLCYCVCDGDKFEEFQCFSNTKQFDVEIQQVLESVKNVPSSKPLHDAQANCGDQCPNCDFNFLP